MKIDGKLKMFSNVLGVEKLPQSHRLLEPTQQMKRIRISKDEISLPSQSNRNTRRKSSNLCNIHSEVTVSFPISQLNVLWKSYLKKQPTFKLQLEHKRTQKPEVACNMWFWIQLCVCGVGGATPLWP